jgi:hypothetical protein
VRRKDLAEMRRRLAEEEDLILGGYEPVTLVEGERWIKCHAGDVLTRQGALEQIREERESRRPLTW